MRGQWHCFGHSGVDVCQYSRVPLKAARIAASWFGLPLLSATGRRSTVRLTAFGEARRIYSARSGQPKPPTPYVVVARTRVMSAVDTRNSDTSAAFTNAEIHNGSLARRSPPRNLSIIQKSMHAADPLRGLMSYVRKSLVG